MRVVSVRTPFLTEDPQKGPAGKFCRTEPSAECPWCNHRFRSSPTAPSESRSAKVRTPTDKPALGGPADVVACPDRGALQPIAAKVLMKILYAARMARFDLLRAVCHLACFITKWADEHDRRLHRLACYIHTTKSHRMVGWVGDPASALSLHVYADADFAGCTDTQRSTSGFHLQMRGSHICFPLSGVSKRQNCVSHSTPEAELVAASYALRQCGLPAQALWDRMCVPRLPTAAGDPASSFGPSLRVLVDNQAMIACVRSGRNPTMRYLGRTRRISVVWLKEVCDAPRVHLAFVESAQQAAGIFAKASTDFVRWTHVCSPIRIGTPATFLAEATSFLPPPDGGGLCLLRHQF